MKKRKLGIIGGSGLYKMEGFEKTKWKKEFCDCAIDKVKLNYNSFSEISENEGDITTILLECIE